MASKKPKAAPTDEELLAQFEGLGDDGDSKAVPKPSTSARTARNPLIHQQQSEADLLAELDSLAQERPKSRPHTPRLSSSVAIPVAQASPKRTGTATPPPAAGSTQSSEEKSTNPPLSRKFGDSTRSFHQSFTPAESEAEPEPEKKASAVPKAAEEQGSGGGWWGGIFATASAAVKQAEALAKELQKNEEAQRWAEQVKGNVGAIRGLGRFVSAFLYAPV